MSEQSKEFNRFQEARKTMADELSEDEGLYIAYHANIAMLLHDNWGITDFERRNEAAEQIISLIFSIPPTQEKDKYWIKNCNTSSEEGECTKT